MTNLERLKALGERELASAQQALRDAARLREAMKPVGLMPGTYAARGERIGQLERQAQEHLDNAAACILGAGLVRRAGEPQKPPITIHVQAPGRPAPDVVIIEDRRLRR